MNETKSNIFLSEVSKNLSDKANHILKIKDQISVLSQSLSFFIQGTNYCDESSVVIDIAKENLIICANGCLNTSIMLNQNNDLKIVFDNYKKNIINPLHNAMSILIVTLDALNYNVDVITENDNLQAEKREKYLTMIGSNSTMIDSTWDMLNEQILEPLYEDFNKLEKVINEELVLETN